MLVAMVLVVVVVLIQTAWACTLGLVLMVVLSMLISMVSSGLVLLFLQQYQYKWKKGIGTKQRTTKEEEARSTAETHVEEEGKQDGTKARAMHIILKKNVNQSMGATKNARMH